MSHRYCFERICPVSASCRRQAQRHGKVFLHTYGQKGLQIFTPQTESSTVEGEVVRRWSTQAQAHTILEQCSLFSAFVCRTNLWHAYTRRLSQSHYLSEIHTSANEHHSGQHRGLFWHFARHPSLLLCILHQMLQLRKLYEIRNIGQ